MKIFNTILFLILLFQPYSSFAEPHDSTKPITKRELAVLESSEHIPAELFYLGLTTLLSDEDKTAIKNCEPVYKIISSSLQLRSRVFTILLWF